MACLIHLVKRSGSLSITVAWDQLMTWFSWVAWSVRADLLFSVKLDARRLLAHMTTFLTWRLPVVSRTRRTEYQLLLIEGL